MGVIDSSQAHRHRLLLKVRDAETQLVLRQVEAEPRFVAVSLTPLSGEAGRKGLYHLDIEVPADATAGRHQGRRPASSGCSSTTRVFPSWYCGWILPLPAGLLPNLTPLSSREDPDR